ncbi:ubiquitinyl hydrolase 1 [Dictyocaulus viviparus]|uniref:ubiquitinyl hydrolase 1 n=1 Tax=Dictyocaulus viviparus TaxID=29172 RepID=A0A0D8XED5_DICVI|nr:ubiquitinyl hydrolase 1 [Dictyocaulus viviparus]
MFFGKDSSACYPMEHGAQVKDPCCDVFERSPNNSLKNKIYYILVHILLLSLPKKLVIYEYIGRVVINKESSHIVGVIKGKFSLGQENVEEEQGLREMRRKCHSSAIISTKPEHIKNKEVAQGVSGNVESLNNNKKNHLFFAFMQHLKKNDSRGNEIIEGLRKEKPLQDAHDISKTVNNDYVIPKETVQQLRQKVMNESRQPSTPKANPTHDFVIPREPVDSEKTPTSVRSRKCLMTASRDSTSSTLANRISLDVGFCEKQNNDVLFYSLVEYLCSVLCHRRWKSVEITSSGKVLSFLLNIPVVFFPGLQNLRALFLENTSYKWQVSSIDVRREYKEPDVRSCDSRSSNCGSTVRRNIPCGRIRDLANLFEKMSEDVGVVSRRGKSLPPTTQRPKFRRARSVPKTSDTFLHDDSKVDSRNLLKQLESREPIQESPLSLKSSQNLSDGRVHSNRQHLKLGEHVTPTTEQDEIVSTDSRVDLRRTSTPVLNRVDRVPSLAEMIMFFDSGGLANAFGCVTSIPSHENSAVLHDQFYKNRASSICHKREYHDEQSAVVKITSPPGRCAFSKNLTTLNSNEPIYAKVCRVSASRLPSASINISPCQEHDGLSSIGHETLSERTSTVLKHDGHDGCGVIRIDDSSYLPAVPPIPSGTSMVHDFHTPKEISKHQKFSIADYQNIQRVQNMGRTGLDVPARFPPLTAPTPGIGVSTWYSCPETLDALIHCAICNEKTKREKVMTIWRLPKYLTIHLKRFEFLRYERRMRKCKRVITFPLKQFDPASFVDGKKGKSKYECIAIANHYGQLSSGYFIAYARGSGDKWLLLNDCSVKEVNEDEVDRADAYLLFFERMD